MIKAALLVFKDLFLVIAFSLFLALILSQEFHGRLFARAIFFLPVIVASGVVLGIINGDEFSQELMSGQSSQMQLDLLQNILINTGLSEDTISTVVETVGNIFNITWRCGIQVLIFLSGIKSIPVSVKEAASVEGATAWEFFWKITFPMILPMVQLNMIFTIIDSFTDSSNAIISRIYSLNQAMDFSYSSTIAWTYFIVVFIIVILVYGILNRISKRYER
ncbi:MAG: sugar ABC transporter permease [Clostridia bacterium]|nr:sugar ABC transporter permease [Clostridia bacterium]